MAGCVPNAYSLMLSHARTEERSKVAEKKKAYTEANPAILDMGPGSFCHDVFQLCNHGIYKELSIGRPLIDSRLVAVFKLVMVGHTLRRLYERLAPKMAWTRNRALSSLHSNNSWAWTSYALSRSLRQRAEESVLGRRSARAPDGARRSDGLGLAGCWVASESPMRGGTSSSRSAGVQVSCSIFSKGPSALGTRVLRQSV